MQIVIDANNNITAWCTVGSFEGGIDVDTMPEDNPLSYKYIDGKLVKNPDYKPPEPPPAPIASDAVAMAVAELAAQVEANQLANQFAIAELAETMMAGGGKNG